jgi:hypothetical protein
MWLQYPQPQLLLALAIHGPDNKQGLLTDNTAESKRNAPMRTRTHICCQLTQLLLHRALARRLFQHTPKDTSSTKQVAYF